MLHQNEAGKQAPPTVPRQLQQESMWYGWNGVLPADLIICQSFVVIPSSVTLGWRASENTIVPMQGLPDVYVSTTHTLPS